MAKKNQAALGEQARLRAKRMQRGAKVAAALMTGKILAGLGGCDNSTNPTPQPKPEPEPKVCECPNGTEHAKGTSMPCCDGEDCTCTVKQPIVCACPAGTFHDEGTACCNGEDCNCREAYNVSLGTKQIRVEDTTGQANRTEIQETLTFLHTTFSASPNVIHFENMNTNPVMVIENTHDFRVEGSKFFIGIDEINNDVISVVYQAIIDIYNSGNTPLMSKLSNKKINGLGIKFDAMKNIIYISRAAIQHQRQRLQA